MKERERERKEGKEDQCLLLLQHFTRREEESASRLYTIIIEKALLLLYFYFYHPSFNWYLIKNGFIITLKRIEHLFARV